MQISFPSPGTPRRFASLSPPKRGSRRQSFSCEKEKPKAENPNQTRTKRERLFINSARR
jgi:hypothetical protein